MKIMTEIQWSHDIFLSGEEGIRIDFTKSVLAFFHCVDVYIFEELKKKKNLLEIVDWLFKEY